MNTVLRQLREQILTLSYTHTYPHLGSCLTAVDAIHAIYQIKKRDEPFVLSNGHAAIAWYCVLHKYGYMTKSDMNSLLVHPERDLNHGISVSTGSLGHGLAIAVGMALADKKRRVFCMISDGECMEGSIWETFRIIRELQLTNLVIVLNANGWGAYRAIDTKQLQQQIHGFGLAVVVVDGASNSGLRKALSTNNRIPTVILSRTNVDQFPFLKGLSAHYHVMSKSDLDLALKQLRYY